MASMRSGSVTKYGERYPRSNCMPSTTSSCVSMVLDSSTVMTPSLPTFFMASAMILPMVSSLLAEMVPTCAIMSPVTGLESSSMAPLMRLPSLSTLPQTAVTAFVKNLKRRSLDYARPWLASLRDDNYKGLVPRLALVATATRARSGRQPERAVGCRLAAAASHFLVLAGRDDDAEDFFLAHDDE